jgi:BlaI family penicillinase repressor
MDKRLKDSEWIILRVLWDEQPLDLKDIIARVQEQNSDVSWDYKTYHSFLRILVEKGYVTAKKRGKNNLYSPAITQEQALSYETDSLISRRNYYGSVSSLMVHMAEQGKLTSAEKLELRELAARLAEEDAKE